MTDSQGFRDLKAYQMAFDLAMESFEESKKFPPEEKYSLTDQIRRSSGSVAANIGEGYRKKRYRKMFVSKIADADGEAAGSSRMPNLQAGREGPARARHRVQAIERLYPAAPAVHELQARVANVGNHRESTRLAEGSLRRSGLAHHI